MRVFKLFGAALLGIASTFALHVEAADTPRASVDLITTDGAAAVDGMKVDREGNLYVTAPDGLRIYSPQGQLLGTITAPRSVHNIAWGGEDGRTLYLCASDRLYRINLLIEGIRP